MLHEWTKRNYLKKYYAQTLEINEDVADRNQEGLAGWRKDVRKLGCINWLTAA